VAYRRADAIREDHTGKLRDVMAGSPRVSSHPRAALDVITVLRSRRRLTWAAVIRR
jgi:hypothetical protein